jgi:hypothetical protein
VKTEVIVWFPSWLETGEIVQLTFPLESVVPEQLCAPSVNVTVWPDGFGGTAPSSSRVALAVSDDAFARITVGPVYVSVVSSRVIVNGWVSELAP